MKLITDFYTALIVIVLSIAAAGCSPSQTFDIPFDTAVQKLSERLPPPDPANPYAHRSSYPDGPKVNLTKVQHVLDADQMRYTISFQISAIYMPAEECRITLTGEPESRTRALVKAQTVSFWWGLFGGLSLGRDPLEEELMEIVRSALDQTQAPE
ncbi:MAG: hypothetical protein AAF797_13610 [Planctomycetota bacterium]